MKTVIEGRKVTVRLGNQLVISESNFYIPERSITAVIGPNGSGKSTLLNVAAGLLPTSSGSLKVFGMDAVQAQTQIAYVLQQNSVSPGIPITVREIVSMGRYPLLGFFQRQSEVDRAKVDEALGLLRISDLAGRQVSDLSVGQKQRVFVAQALAQDHRLLFMDEPMSALDLESARTIDDIIHAEPARGCSVVFTTHDLQEAKVADHVILMSGSVIASGKPAEVLTEINLSLAFGLGRLHPESFSQTDVFGGGHE